MNQARQGGFTLLELMIVVTIIGILAGIAMVTYNNYATRAKVVEGLIMVGRPQVAIVEFYLSQSRWPADNTEAGLIAPTAYASPYLKSITVLPAGQIEVAYTPEAGNGTIVFQATTNSNGTQWNCQGGTMIAVYRPQMCR